MYQAWVKESNSALWLTLSSLIRLAKAFIALIFTSVGLSLISIYNFSMNSTILFPISTKAVFPSKLTPI